jgi:GAF domain-containing protein
VSSEAQGELTGLQNALLNTDSIEQFLHELARLAVRSLSDDATDEVGVVGEAHGAAGGTGETGDTARGAGAEMSCGMALRQRGRPEPVAACSDPLASEADRVQYQAQDGPALHVLRHARPVSVRDTASDQRWPRFCRQAASLGIRSCYAVPLVADGEPAGALVLYARSPGAFGPERASKAERFGRHASGALTLALRLSSCADQNDQLRSSIMSRAVIDQALGVIMATERCPQDRAFALLRNISQNTNVKLRDLAATIVTNVSGEQPKAAAPFEDS